MEYGKTVSSKTTPQKRKIPGKKQVKNNAGGYVFEVDNMQRVRRFLILGSDSNTVYQSSKTLTIQNANIILEEIKKGNGKAVIDMAVDISSKGLARKNEPAIFALCLGLTHGDTELKQYIVENFTQVIRIGTHLFQFMHTLKQLRGMGKITKKLFAKWYLEKPVDKLAFQAIKYQGRTVEEGSATTKWENRDILRLMKFKTSEVDRDNLFHYLTKGNFKREPSKSLAIVEGFEKAKNCGSEKDMIKLIQDYGLTREMVPTQFLNKPAVQEVIFENSGITAIVRSLATWTSSGLISDYNTAFINKVISKFADGAQVKLSKIHPLQVADAIKTYSSGKSVKGSSIWKPVRKITDSLNNLFYLSFGNIEPTNKKIMLGLDVSGSMGGSKISGSLLTPREASAILAMVTARVESEYIIKGFSHKLVDMDISPNISLEDIIRKVNRIDFGNTDCALPILDAMENRCGDIDTFIIYTDNETWYGGIHPSQALVKYRSYSGLPAKLIVVGMTSTGFTIADPNDPGMFDIVGCSTDTPSLISDIIKGNI